MIFICPKCDEEVTICKEDLKRGISCPMCHNGFEGFEIKEILKGKKNEKNL